MLTDGTVLWPGPHDRLYGLTSPGRLLWTVQLDGLVLSPAVVGRRAYIADNTGILLALDPDQRGPPRQAWRLDVGGTSYSSRRRRDQQRRAVRPAPPGRTVRWRFDRGDWAYSSTVVRERRAGFGDHLGRGDILDTASGRLVRSDLGLPKA